MPYLAEIITLWGNMICSLCLRCDLLCWLISSDASFKVVCKCVQLTKAFKKQLTVIVVKCSRSSQLKTSFVFLKYTNKCTLTGREPDNQDKLERELKFSSQSELLSSLCSLRYHKFNDLSLNICTSICLDQTSYVSLIVNIRNQSIYIFNCQ